MTEESVKQKVLRVARNLMVLPRVLPADRGELENT